LKAILSSVSSQKGISKLFGVTLAQKQFDPSLNIATIHKTLYEEKFGGIKAKFAEFLLVVALESGNLLKRSFAIMSLVEISKKQRISLSVMSGIFLCLLNDESQVIRKHTLTLIDIYTKDGTSSDDIDVFLDTPKPVSTIKYSKSRTPIKQKSLKPFL